jgi:hypothetical protein
MELGFLGCYGDGKLHKEDDCMQKIWLGAGVALYSECNVNVSGAKY